ncbi:hypothetical protein JQ628_33405 [Bradyrhizobium lablabi]|nr:hypothetical protein [Bradyrhizobium lablabi]MBR1126458.1 hypothetical protein [Bradyrhizobium lablabi]
MTFAMLAAVCLCDPALAEEDDDEGASAAPAIPNLYLDLRTNFGAVPAGSLSLGFGNTALFTTLQTLQQIRPDNNMLPALPRGVSLPASQSIFIDFPFSIDVSDRISLYGGPTASTSRTDFSDWSQLTVTSWNVGVQADLYQQNGGMFPTVTLQTTVTRAVPDGPLATISLNNVVEFNYALNEDETRGWLAGFQHTKVDIESPLARIGSNLLGYVGGYYQWDNNWKFTGRIGMQSFGGASLLRQTPIEAFTQPIVRLDLDRMDDNDNRLFGITAQIAWVPKPAYQLTVRTPLYAVRN